MSSLLTLFSSNSPIDCYIMKGRLETDGITCFVFDEYFAWVHPFRAGAIGGVKLKVPKKEFAKAQKVIQLIDQETLVDEIGAYHLQTEFEKAIQIENEVLDAKTKLRSHPNLISNPEKFVTKKLSKEDLKFIAETEKEYLELKQNKLSFTWKQFFYELFDFDRSVIKYLRRRPPEYYLSKEVVEHYNNPGSSGKVVSCPNCKSVNVSFGYAIDRKWDFPYLILSLLIFAPFPPIRKNYHCYDCVSNFTRSEAIKKMMLSPRDL